MEQALWKLTRDDGHGQALVDQAFAKDQQVAAGSSRVPGLGIRYQATLALARRASDKVPLDLLRDMLDERQLLDSFQLTRPDGQTVPDETTARATVLGALLAITEWHRKQPDRELAGLYPALEQLAQSPHSALRRDAQRTLIELKKK
jgi:hypothetical protein